MARIASMDVVRGFAILVMFVDHILFLLGYSSFSMFDPRFFTRIAEPLFAVLFGYFLFGRKDESLVSRFFEITIAAVFINAIVFPLMGDLEILASFALSFIIYIMIRERIIFLLPLALIFNIDPTAAFLQYPMSLVLSQVALGFGMRKGVSPLVSLIFAGMFFFVIPNYQYTFLFTALACAILLVAEKNKGFSIPIIEYIGQRPLFFYILQYLVALFLIIIFAKPFSIIQ
ncbi:MAG: hypothetical protein NTY68_02945 [Candidatus Micrarchaeota archaeon]|nr:hypothetical protein [Candidatus Micrarchaeota archaeon]